MLGIEPGPNGRLHVPNWRDDCWKGRPEGCCWVCYCRLLWAIARGP